MIRWMTGMAVLTMIGTGGCKEKTRIVVVPQAPAEPPPPVAMVEPPPPAPVVITPTPVVVAPAPVVAAPAPVVVAPAPVVVEPIAAPAVSVSFFVERLGHHGRWTTVATYGQVWVPAGVAGSWAPYTLGHWVYTEDYGWTWVSDEPWGWATYHYGRWVFLEPQGWVWVPGTVWGPAWVVWRSGGGYVGWAPMPPEAVVAPVAARSVEVNINININIEKHIRSRHWVFVEERHILEPVRTHIVAARSSSWIINVTRPSNRFVAVQGRIVNRSLAVRDVERATGRSVRPLRVREVDAGATGDARMVARGSEVVVPRARLQPIQNPRAGAPAPTGRASEARQPASPPLAAGAGSAPGRADPRVRRPVSNRTAAPSPAPSPAPGRARPDSDRAPVDRIPNADVGAPQARPIPNAQGKAPVTRAQPAPASPPVAAPPANTPRRAETDRNVDAGRRTRDADRGTTGARRASPAAPPPSAVQPQPAPPSARPTPAAADKERPGRVRQAAPPAAKEPPAAKDGPSAERARSGRRGAAPDPSPSASSSAGVRGGRDVGRERSRSPEERGNDREGRQAD